MPQETKRHKRCYQSCHIFLFSEVLKLCKGIDKIKNINHNILIRNMGNPKQFYGYVHLLSGMLQTNRTRQGRILGWEGPWGVLSMALLSPPHPPLNKISIDQQYLTVANAKKNKEGNHRVTPPPKKKLPSRSAPGTRYLLSNT